MKLAKSCLAITLVVTSGGLCSWGQTPSPSKNPPPDAVQSMTRAYRLTYTLTETDGGKRVGTQHFSMIVVNGRTTKVRQGSRVPLATGALSNSGGAQTQIQYMDVGLRIEASLDSSIDVVRLNSNVEQSSIAEEKSGLGAQDPIVRETILEGTSILTEGKPVMLGSMDIPGSTRHLDVEVVMEPVVQ